MVSIKAIVALVAATLAITSTAAPVESDVNVEMAVGRDALGLMEQQWLQDREVINPKITSPTAQTVWTSGKTVTVTWDPKPFTGKFASYKGTILLGYSKPNGEGGSNLDVEHPLAQGFLLSSGKKTFTLPASTSPHKKAFVVVMGDSGNRSPAFKIVSPHPHPRDESEVEAEDYSKRDNEQVE